MESTAGTSAAHPSHVTTSSSNEGSELGGDFMMQCGPAAVVEMEDAGDVSVFKAIQLGWAI